MNTLRQKIKDFHEPKLFGLPRNDLILTILISVLIGYVYGLSVAYVVYVFVILILVGIIIHYLLDIDTSFMDNVICRKVDMINK